MPQRVNHNQEIPKIAQAIREYKLTHKTQKQCAAEFGIPYKLFSYYYLNGFKKNQKVGGGLIPDETPYQKKAKGRANNYEVILVGGDGSTQEQPQFQPPPVSHQYVEPPKQKIVPKKPATSATISINGDVNFLQKKNSPINPSINEKIKSATILKNGKKHVNLDGFI